LKPTQWRSPKTMLRETGKNTKTKVFQTIFFSKNRQEKFSKNHFSRKFLSQNWPPSYCS
jgi:hypothetical protein